MRVNFFETNLIAVGVIEPFTQLMYGQHFWPILANSWRIYYG